MKPYGVKPKDRGCCPGHDKFPGESYRITRRHSVRARRRPAKKRPRQQARRAIACALVGA
jgi:hypothetical protein